MILLADSGSTKTDWLLLNNDGNELAKERTIGLNPYHITNNKLEEVFNTSFFKKYSSQINKLYFYGAGCSNELMISEFKTKLSSYINIENINVYSDIEGAVLASTSHYEEDSIVSILGTGSTFRLYENNKIVKVYSSLGYILGDEGSGCYIGKNLLRGIFYKNLSKNIRAAFYETYKLNHETLMHQIYKENLRNKYIASFVPFCKKHIKNVEIEALIKDSFQSFFDSHLNKFLSKKNYLLHFVGGISAHFETQLRAIAKSNNARIGEIIDKPLPYIKEAIFKNKKGDS